MINVYVIVWILFIHWFADFVCQPDRWARNKSKSNAVLLSHVGLYSTLVAVVGVGFISNGLMPIVWMFLVSFVCHFVTDYITSRITSKLYEKQLWHNFFVVIGFDQFLHATQLLLTYYYLCR
jgi:hypothetical protein